ncbi:MAG: TIGR00645 family protein [Betaproteobacteria bacterium]|nr:TIGR00645 family protein [Betaproteobacteria bacterium]
MSNLTNNMKTSIEKLIFCSRWLQVPLYLGLIVALGVFAFYFFVELYRMITGAGIQSEYDVMLIMLGLVDLVMIANLVVMVIIGGYETFVSHLKLDDHPDQPEWLSHISAGVLKIKLSTAIISISSIHLLKTFIYANDPNKALATENWVAQVAIHLTFIISALAIAYTDKLMYQTAQPDKQP